MPPYKTTVRQPVNHSAYVCVVEGEMSKAITHVRDSRLNNFLLNY